MCHCPVTQHRRIPDMWLCFLATLKICMIERVTGHYFMNWIWGILSNNALFQICWLIKWLTQHCLYVTQLPGSVKTSAWLIDPALFYDIPCYNAFCSSMNMNMKYSIQPTPWVICRRDISNRANFDRKKVTGALLLFQTDFPRLLFW